MELWNYPSTQKCRYYEIEAIEIPIVYNQYGDHDPNGLLYVLKKDAEKVRKAAQENFQMSPPQPAEEVKPLVIRANVGDRIRIRFTHSLKRALSIHVQGLKYDVQTSDGASVGFNRDTTTENEIVYTWYADKEGVYSFQDMGDTRSSEEGTNVHGLFGAIIVEEAESVWLDPETGAELSSGLFADIYHPARPAFREYAVFFHDELEIKDKDGNQPVDPHTRLPSATTAISYRSEPMRNRPPLTEEHSDTGEDISMSSWVYGDPAPPILRAYVGDPAKIRLIHGGVKENHVFHLHNHQWKLEGDNPNSTIIDSVSISPQECYTLDILHGAGSLNRTIGDVIFHCHLYPHFHGGMWTLWRIYDRLEDGTGMLPDGTVIPPLQPLKDRIRPPKKDELHPGYPNFIEGTFGEAPLQPPLGVLCVEPLVIRANAGDCIEVRLTNLLPEYLKESPFQMETKTDIVGYHIHLVKFDTIVADGAANGWNNIAGARKYETLIERFFLNTELRTVFFHDHLFANSHQQHGVFGALLVEEAGATFHDIRTGKEINYGTKAVIKRIDGTSFREFALFVHDFALLFDGEGNPLNPPEVPGSHDDPGVMGINYRCEPMRERLKDHSDPAYIFSSIEHGDPATPILETYPGDEMMIRLLDGAHEEQHAFNLTGMSWKREIADPLSPDVASQTIGISEAFNIHVTKQYDPGDYLYYFGGADDVWLGLWGIIRVYHHRRKCLKPLCKERRLPLPPCPGKNAIIRKYEVAAIQRKIRYNRYGDHDPDGLLFVPLDMPHKPSMRVSLNPQFLNYDPVYDSGINVGYNNREQTVGPGESKKYLWYADREYGACIVQSFGDIRNHRYHGLFGAVIVEPPGARWYRNFSLSKAMHEEEVVITAPGTESFRECVVMIQNGIRMLDKDGNLVKTTASEEGEAPDAEDTGEKGYNYRSERFANRLKKDSRISQIFSSRVHGDPATPVFKAYTKERVVFRTMMPADKPRNTGFLIHGNQWKEQPKDPYSRIVPMQGAVSIGNTFNMELRDGACCPGDYLYRSGSLKWDVESGMWGIFRVLKQGIGCKCRNTCRKLMNCIGK